MKKYLLEIKRKREYYKAQGGFPLSDQSHNLSDQAVEELIRSHMWLVDFVINKKIHLPPIVDRSELYSAGLEGLWGAVRLCGYAPNLKGVAIKFIKAKVRAAWFRDRNQAAWANVFLDSPLKTDSETTLGEQMPSTRDDLIGRDDQLDYASMVEKLLRFCSPKERRVLRLHFIEEHSVEKVGRVMGISAAWVSELYRRAFDKLKLLAQVTNNPFKWEKEAMPSGEADIGVFGFTVAMTSGLASKGIVSLGSLRSMSTSGLLALGLHPKTVKSLVRRMVMHGVWFADGEQATRQLLEKGACAQKNAEVKQESPPILARVPTSPNGNNALVQLTASSMAGAIAEFLRTGNATVESIQTTVTLSVAGKKFQLDMTLAPKEE